jgi:trimethylamine---corrinoid protein Co-methyltransferase
MTQLKLLAEEDVRSIHLATLRILDETGLVLEDAGARELLTAAGARLDGKRVKFPPDLVESSLADCPSIVSLRGRSGTTKLLGKGSLNFHNLGGARDIYNAADGSKRYASIEDLQNATRLLDALENCNTITPFFTPCDVPGELMSLLMYRHALPNTTKPLQGPGVQFPGEVKFATRMAEVIGPATEVLSLAVSPVSPLNIPAYEAQAIMAIARAGVAFGPLPCPTAGTTAPLSMAGALAQQNAEVLAPIVLAQLVHPGLPVIYCGRLAMMEPRTGISVWGGIELAIVSAATVQLGHFYHLPVNVYGFSTNSHVLDIQDGFERGISAAIPALAGADELSGIGEMEAGVSGSFAQMVADNEFAASILRLRRGFEVNDDALAVEVIAKVMNGSHNFLGQKHTMQYLKSGEMMMTRLAERGTWENWEEGGRLGLLEHAQAEAERILREHQVEPLEAAQVKELDAIMVAAEKELVQ